MRALFTALVLTVTALPATAQPAAPDPKLFASAADVAALITKAKTDRKPDQANLALPIVRTPPYSANLEYRVAGLKQNSTSHALDAEMFYVLEGAGTVITGGKLIDEKPTANPGNTQGSGIAGGARRRIAKGDFVMVPPGVPHSFDEIDGALVLMSIHMIMPK